MLKRILNNPALTFLLLGNLYCIWYYQQYPNSFGNIVWIYWSQSIIIGLFNFFELFGSNQFSQDSFNSKAAAGCLPWFFLLHFGGFHLVYFVFLMIKFPIYDVSRLFYLTAIGIFFIESLIGFIRYKRQRERARPAGGFLFFLPYLRIIPMHLMILGPAFLGWEPSIIFLLLKTFADLLSYRLYNSLYNKQVAN